MIHIHHHEDVACLKGIGVTADHRGFFWRV